MKIKTAKMDYDAVMAIPKEAHKSPAKQSPVLRWVMKTASAPELKAVDFTYEEIGMEKLGDEPALYLMNHSSFTDLQIIATLLHNRQYHIVCTNDGLIAKDGLMRAVGCIPTKKFITDITLVRDMKYAVSKLKSSIVMYPEASYTFDGTETPLPDSLGKCLKLLNIPVIMIKTEGAFLRDPLYNLLQKRDTKVSATITYLLSPEDIKTKSVDELNACLKDAFVYDHFKAQYEHGVIIDEPFRADGLHRVLYKCPNCQTEGRMVGKGTSITCTSCGEVHTLDETGTLSKEDGKPVHRFVSDWYKWERDNVREEILNGTYEMDLEVDIKMLVDSKCIYEVGEGRLIHNKDGFTLTGCDGRLNFTMSSKSSYSLYADYYWYELGDMICIGDTDRQYYCFPKDQEAAIVAKARLATEEMYKIANSK